MTRSIQPEPTQELNLTLLQRLSYSQLLSLFPDANRYFLADAIKSYDSSARGHSPDNIVQMVVDKICEGNSGYFPSVVVKEETVAEDIGVYTPMERKKVLMNNANTSFFRRPASVVLNGDERDVLSSNSTKVQVVDVLATRNRDLCHLSSMFPQVAHSHLLIYSTPNFCSFPVVGREI
ncbi:hypothetical protein BT69DRAFT_707891 [Atractiella rhizophila]|nr:hypothetical protein BT69DRAFT_707891 [Atractiella rhizophila]